MPSVKPPRPVVVAAGWLAAALVATLAGLGGIRLVGDSLTGTPGGVRSAEDVERALAAAPVPSAPTSAPPSAAASSSPAAARGTQAVFAGAGGTATVRCRPGDQAYLDSWSPAPGYRVHDYDRGPDDEVRVRFEGPDGRAEFRFHCAGGVPQREQRRGGSDDDD
ncbi:septum formation initiator [Actinoplanes sp. M2I2]|uniref:septum formation initiator n=1 Tax=Actinoplanes sp. M2I2 TaxID=1734444 RepID=UPI002022888E|nr:septum formation initiator [Actinoplanes sp. M2I2]